MMKKKSTAWDPAKVKTGCKWYRGHIPCVPHKKEGVFCTDCGHYEKLGRRILIIKLGAAGDVIRTTPLLRRLRKDDPAAEIVWLTYFPDLVPKDWVNKVVTMEIPRIVWLRAQRFDWLINLDKDDEAIALAGTLNAAKKSGFLMDAYGKCRAAAGAAPLQKWMTGLWDDLNKANTKNYMEEIFEICGYSFKNEPYILPKGHAGDWGAIDRKKKIVGLNTGCGGRWATRLWDERHWIALAKRLDAAGDGVVLLGGPQEHEKNRRIAEASGAKYFGYFELPVFIDLVNQCDVVVSQVTMAMHIAIGLGKTLILMNNIFNQNEFYLYGKGRIVQPDLKCLGCFKQAFDERCPVPNCMDLIEPDQVFSAIHGR